jgi:hypothetical protein
MILTFFSFHFDKCWIVQPFGLSKDRASHVDHVIKCKRANDMVAHSGSAQDAPQATLWPTLQFQQ